MNRNLILAGLGALVAAAVLHLGGAPSAAAAPAFCAKHSATYYITACVKAPGGGGPVKLCPAEPCEQPDGTEAASSPLRDALRKALTGGGKPATPSPSTSTGSDAGGGGSE
ncbi:membrane protein [Mycobacterium phage Ekdilam]|uniref:Uncharacterized protein n=1 Tax=Mycobacterium phage Ekdilam TaxID=2599862 RepID=A0A5J6TKY6_9CAUD|nr:membrane protein [Mycobacterium phage Ekdilam]QFG11495.1 hypothetical protein PBI_EKDILAM_71 [Mycobacterium phage Ekdilam]